MLASSLSLTWAYSIAVERLHGMEEVGVRLPVGPPMNIGEHPTTNPLVRFFKYSSVGVSTFALDLAMLYLLTDFLGVHYLASAAIAFICAVTLNYSISRQYVFIGTKRDLRSGYVFFLIIAGIGLCAVIGLMYLSVDVFGMNYVISRVLIAGFVGIWTYLMNLYVNFRVVGE